MAALELWRDNIDHFSLTPPNRRGQPYWIMDDVGRTPHRLDDEREWGRLAGEMRSVGVKVFEDTRDWSEYTRAKWVSLYATLGDLIAYYEEGETRPSLVEWVRFVEQAHHHNPSWQLLFWLELCYRGLETMPRECHPERAAEVETLFRMLPQLGWIFSIKSNQLDFRPTVSESHRRAILQYVWDVTLHCPSETRS